MDKGYSGGHLHPSKRLRAIARMVTPGNRVCDVGCDHAYLPIYLLQEKRIPSAIGLDIHPGPLKRAKENIEAARLNQKIELRLSDGMEALSPGEAESIVIAGMGGQLICSILERGKELFGADSAITELILSPHSEVEKVRSYLAQEGFQMEDEIILKDAGKYYMILKAHSGTRGKKSCNTHAVHPEEMRFGPILLRKKDSLLLEYLTEQKQKLQELYHLLQESKGEQAKRRLPVIEEDIRVTRRALRFFEQKE